MSKFRKKLLKFSNHPLFQLILALTIVIILNAFLAITLTVKVILDARCRSIEKPNLRSTERIIGGVFSDIRSYPFIVAIVIYKDYQVSFECGGVIISRYWFITAAHCDVTGSENAAYYAVGGNSRWRNGYHHKIVDFIIHDLHNYAAHLDNDVALGKVHEPFGSYNELPITLAGNNYAYQAGKPVIVVGWGLATYPQGHPSETLKSTTIQLIDQRDCEQLYQRVARQLNERLEVTSSMICAGSYYGDRDACKADSGGPLVDGRLLIGLVSWAHGCGVPQQPGVYTKINLYSNWIISTGIKHNESIGATFYP